MRALIAALFTLNTVPASSAIRPLFISPIDAPIQQITLPIKMALHSSALTQRRPLNVTEVNFALPLTPIQTEVIDHDTKELNLALLQKAQKAVDARRFNPANYVPYQSLNSTDGTAQVTSKILSKTLQTIANREIADNSLLDLPVIKSASYVKAVRAKNYKITYGIRNTLAETELKIHKSISATLSYNIASPEMNFGFHWSF